LQDLDFTIKFETTKGKSKRNNLLKQNIKEIHQRIINSFLDVIIMGELLQNDSLSGYDVIRIFYKKFGILLSPGTIYSVLYSMERNGLIEGKENSHKRVYNLTEIGEKTIKNMLNSIEEIQKFIRFALS
jgi:DNA-binding PadR family transcriptional regulator